MEKKATSNNRRMKKKLHAKNKEELYDDNDDGGGCRKNQIMLCMHCHLTSFRITHYTSRMICRGAFVIIFVVGVSLSSLLFFSSLYWQYLL